MRLWRDNAGVDYLPVFMDLRDRPVLLVGAGTVAARKLELLLAAGARPRVVAPAACEAVQSLAAAGRIDWRRERFAPGHLEGVVFVVAATDDRSVNAAVRAAAEVLRLWVNAVDDPAASNCIMPAIIDRSPVVVAVSTGGAAPTLARRLRGQLESLLPGRLGELARLAQGARGALRAALPQAHDRARFWEQFFDGALAQQVLTGAVDAATAAELLAVQLRDAAATGAPLVQAASGVVYLVGAGPGDPDLLTLRAQQLLQSCDVVLYDRLVPDAVLARARRDAERIYVGKEPGRHRVTQEQIHGQLLLHARAGRRVVRLKGGDPLVFARGGEEIGALAAAGIPVVVVPGITAALGAAAATRIPLTHRGLAQSVCFVTVMGEAAAALDWGALAAPLQTVVMYMGVAELPSICERLQQHGAPAQRPAAVVERATLPGQRVIAGTLADIATRAAQAQLAAPALLIVGEVARFALHP
jgi:uroporphyrin-III C-methyltransferase/precorrin-2 dehydrogenase/sirohydrochlorin ferrochelatase